jgi:hypothetical protein
MKTQATRTPGRLKQGATVGTVVIAATAAALLGAGGGVAVTALQDAPRGPQGEPGVQGPLDLRASRASVVSADPRASAARPGLRGQPVGVLLQSKKAHRRLTLDSTAWLNL